jgi:hypothetical protein
MKFSKKKKIAKMLTGNDLMTLQIYAVFVFFVKVAHHFFKFKLWPLYNFII